MQNNVTELTQKLRRSLDANYNVVDMVAVIDVITSLERIAITKEQLEDTRLGRYVNELRRKTSNQNLAKRAKELVKKWRNSVIPDSNGQVKQTTENNKKKRPLGGALGDNKADVAAAALLAKRSRLNGGITELDLSDNSNSSFKDVFANAEALRKDVIMINSDSNSSIADGKHDPLLEQQLPKKRGRKKVFGKMADDNHISSKSANNIEQSQCAHCKKIVKEAVLCAKCRGVFHPGCMKQSAASKSADCAHSLKNPTEEVRSTIINPLEMENRLLKRIIEEQDSKNKVLQDNITHLKETINLLRDLIELKLSRENPEPKQNPPQVSPNGPQMAQTDRNKHLNVNITPMQQKIPLEPAKQQTSKSYAKTLEMAQKGKMEEMINLTNGKQDKCSEKKESLFIVLFISEIKKL